MRDYVLRNPKVLRRGTVGSRARVERRVAQIEDVRRDPGYSQEVARLGQIRTALGVPLFHDDELIGVITLTRSQVRPFSAREIAVATSFADEAVIAMENARLFNELGQRDEALARSEQRLVDAIEAIPHGFVLFDAEDRLVLANSRFREYYDAIADITVPGVSVQEMLRTAAQRGLVPLWGLPIDEWLEQRMAMRRHPGRPIETQLSTGRWVVIDERRTGEGGLAGVYSDLSPLKPGSTATCRR